MALDHAQLERLHFQSLCPNARVHRHHDHLLMLDPPFTFTDGDHYPIYLSETPGGDATLSNLGLTRTHTTYEYDGVSFCEGARTPFRQKIARESRIDREQAIFPTAATSDQLANGVFPLGPALTKIHGLAFLTRDRVSSPFYDNLTAPLFTMLDEYNVDTNHLSADSPTGNNYPTTYHFAFNDFRLVYYYPVWCRDQERPAAIVLSPFLLHRVTLESVGPYAYQHGIPPIHTTRLANVAAKPVTSTDRQGAFRQMAAWMVAWVCQRWSPYNQSQPKIHPGKPFHQTRSTKMPIQAHLRHPPSSYRRERKAHI